jgi:hypothetical protein
MGVKASKETQNTQAQLTGTIKYWQHNGMRIPKTGIQSSRSWFRASSIIKLNKNQPDAHLF